ncbi:MAG: hypothetical protein ABR581_04670 [Thermoleophilaceae bacterium]
MRARRPPGSPLRGFLRQAAILAAVFAAVSGVAELAGAANLGTALGIGQIAFVIALVVLLLRG